MKVWSAWETIRRQVAIGGRVLDPSARPVAGADVVLTRVPEATRRKTRKDAVPREATSEREEEVVAQTQSSGDGIFYFLDVPAGHYTLVGADRKSARKAQRVISLTWDEKGTIKRVIEDLKLTTEIMPERK